MTTGKTSAEGVGDRLLRAIAHPLRIEILRLLGERVFSPREVALATAAGLGDVSYHVKYLLRNGLIEISDATPRGSSIEHYYRLKQASSAEATLRSLIGEAVRALNAGTVDARRDRRLDLTAMELDEQAWRELIELQTRWSKELERLQTGVAQRLKASGASGVPVVAAILGFQAPS